MVKNKKAFRFVGMPFAFNSFHTRGSPRVLN